MLTSEQIIGQVERAYDCQEDTRNEDTINCNRGKLNHCKYNHSPVLLFVRLSYLSQCQCYKLSSITCFALMTPRLFFLPATMTSAPPCTFPKYGCILPICFN